MVKERMDLLELLRKGGMDGDVDFLREALRVLVEEIMDAEVSSRIGAEYGERSPERVSQRNGYRSRAWDTRVGTMDLHIPKLREGSYFPSLLEPRRRSERALLAVIQQAYVEVYPQGGWTIWSRPWGVRVSPRARCRASVRTGRGGGWFHGPSAGRWILPLPVAGRTDPEGQGGRQDRQRQRGGGDGGQWRGQREIIGMDVGTSEDGAFWLAFLRSLSARGLSGVELVVSDAHQGLPRRHRRSLRRSQLATVPHPLHDQPAHSGPQARPAMGSHHGAHHLPATLPR